MRDGPSDSRRAYLYASVCVTPGSIETKVKHSLEDNGLYFSISLSVSNVAQISSSLSHKAKKVIRPI